MTERHASIPRAPAVVRLFGPVGNLFLRLGVPMGPDRLVTIRGRKSGLPRTVGLAVTELDGRRFVVGAYGDVQWARNLRVAGEAVIGVGRHAERVRAVELDTERAATVLRELAVYINKLPWILRVVTLFMLRFGDAHEVVDSPASAARTRPVFELHRTP
jgi:deazaflavin-dependent oxidoreductase (nitroreductase family)